MYKYVIFHAIQLFIISKVLNFQLIMDILKINLRKNILALLCCILEILWR